MTYLILISTQNARTSCFVPSKLVQAFGTNPSFRLFCFRAGNGAGDLRRNIPDENKALDDDDRSTLGQRPDGGGPDNSAGPGKRQRRTNRKGAARKVRARPQCTIQSRSARSEPARSGYRSGQVAGYERPGSGPAAAGAEPAAAAHARTGGAARAGASAGAEPAAPAGSPAGPGPAA